jgi:murein DD-endopeptidase MepM/ murein hydrolase activator NlpD
LLLAVSLLLLTSAGAAYAAASPYPEIRVLSQDDSLFVQQQSELADFRALSAVHGPHQFPPLSIFAYVKRPSEDLFSLNARIGLRYDTLATLNDSLSPAVFNARSALLVPGQDGLFVASPPKGDLENMIVTTRQADGIAPQTLVIVRDGRKETVLFYPGEGFSGMERAYFLRILYKSPIAKGRITSMWGWRADPFTGAREFHNGIDIGAAEGTDVLAAREGTVDEVGKSDVLGNYLVITHAGGYQTVYGHLSVVSVTLKQRVGTGERLGAVGHTGQATGPHLHFEVRTKAGTTDPLMIVRVK